MTFTPPSQQVFIAISYFADFFLTVYWTANTRMNILPDYMVDGGEHTCIYTVRKFSETRIKCEVKIFKSSLHHFHHFSQLQPKKPVKYNFMVFCWIFLTVYSVRGWERGGGAKFV